MKEACHVCMRCVTRINESHHNMNESRHVRIRLIVSCHTLCHTNEFINESCHTYEFINESWPTCIRLTCVQCFVCQHAATHCNTPQHTATTIHASHVCTALCVSARRNTLQQNTCVPRVYSASLAVQACYTHECDMPSPQSERCTHVHNALQHE